MCQKIGKFYSRNEILNSEFCFQLIFDMYNFNKNWYAYMYTYDYKNINRLKKGHILS